MARNGPKRESALALVVSKESVHPERVCEGVPLGWGRGMGTGTGQVSR